MERVIRLLKEKNQYLEKFFALNVSELERFEASNFDNVTEFYRVRDSILDILRRIDEMLHVENEAQPRREATAEDRAAIEGALNAKESWVAAILEQDLRILERVEQEKSKIIRELQSTTKSRKVHEAYIAGSASGGLDEKA